jgi:competence protein ComGC
MASGSFSIHDARGVTLIETIIALGIIAVLVVTMATLMAVGREVMWATRHEAVALALARARLEQLEGLAFSIYALASGGTVEITDLVTDLSQAAPGVGGRGLSTGPADALIDPQAGYVDYLDAQGQWVGADPSAARRAAYTRRWTVRRIGSGSTEIVTFEVMVAPQAVALRVRGENVLRQPGVVRLVGVRSRRAH